MTLGDLRDHRLIGYVEDYAYASALDYIGELYRDAPTAFRCASAIGQFEAVRSGLGLGVLHRFIASGHADLVPVVADCEVTRTYWIVEHEDTRGLGRIRAVHDFIVDAVAGDRALFMPRAAQAAGGVKS